MAIEREPEDTSVIRAAKAADRSMPDWVKWPLMFIMFGVVPVGGGATGLVHALKPDVEQPSRLETRVVGLERDVTEVNEKVDSLAAGQLYVICLLETEEETACSYLKR